MPNPPDARNELKQRISEAIAKGTPFSAQQVLNAYEKLGSYDSVVAACEYGLREGSDLSSLVAMLFRAEDKPKATAQFVDARIIKQVRHMLRDAQRGQGQYTLADYEWLIGILSRLLSV
jgi:hypothetical protein